MRSIVAHIFLLSVFLVFQSGSGFAEEEEAEIDIAAAISKMMDQARNDEPPEGITKAQLKGADPRQVLALLAPYEKDPESFVRHLAYLYGVRLAEAHPLPQIRQEVTRRLLEAAFSRSWGQAGTHLMRFSARDFNAQSKTLIRGALAQANIGAVGGDLGVWLCGVANLQDQLPRLKELLIDEMEYQAQADKIGARKWYYTTGWAARLARARMGVKEDIEKCIRLVEEAEVNFHRRVTILLPKIAYIRRPQAIECLKAYFLSDERLPPVNRGLPGTPVSQYLMSELADCLVNFPVKKRDSRGYKAEEINLCRRWMVEQKEWRIRR